MARPRFHVRRHPERGRYDRASVEAVLDAAYVAHVAFVEDDGQPYCVPMLYARVGDAVYVHGSSASRVVRTLATGAPACLTVTVLDGLVLARSAFEHSANYRSAMLVGRFHTVEDEADRVAAFEAFTERLVPGRWSEVRGPDRRELKATAILALPIGEAAVKVRVGPPTDDDSPDAERDTWAGVVPMLTRFGPPEPAPALRDGIAIPESVQRLLESGTPPHPHRNGGAHR
jgi:nitroimidazol reductase NimA-like FMN-containing flavoprotein (pyridoxamine 5'-phosphate oxidase superfamily)